MQGQDSMLIPLKCPLTHGTSQGHNNSALLFMSAYICIYIYMYMIYNTKMKISTSLEDMILKPTVLLSHCFIDVPSIGLLCHSRSSNLGFYSFMHLFIIKYLLPPLRYPGPLLWPRRTDTQQWLITPCHGVMYSSLRAQGFYLYLLMHC